MAAPTNSEKILALEDAGHTLEIAVESLKERIDNAQRLGARVEDELRDERRRLDARTLTLDHQITTCIEKVASLEKRFDARESFLRQAGLVLLGGLLSYLATILAK